MFCWWYQKLISDHIDERISPQKNKRLSRHLESCSRCQAYLKSLEIIQAETAPLLPFQVPENYWQDSVAALKKRLMEESSGKLLARQGRWFEPVRWRLAWVLTAVGVVVMAIYLLLPRTQSSEPEVIVSAEILPSLLSQIETDPWVLDAFNDAIEAEIGHFAPLEDNYLIYLENHALLLEELSDEEISLFLREIQKEGGIDGL